MSDKRAPLKHIAYSTHGRPVGSFDIKNESRPGQRCIQYCNYTPSSTLTVVAAA